jgi:hypothetical protein
MRRLRVTPGPGWAVGTCHAGPGMMQWTLYSLLHASCGNLREQTRAAWRDISVRVPDCIAAAAPAPAATTALARGCAAKSTPSPRWRHGGSCPPVRVAKLVGRRTPRPSRPPQQPGPQGSILDRQSCNRIATRLVTHTGQTTSDSANVPVVLSTQRSTVKFEQRNSSGVHRRGPSCGTQATRPCTISATS